MKETNFTARVNESRSCLLDEEEQHPVHSHRKLWLSTALTLAVLVAAAAYGYWAIGSYRGRLDLVPSLQSQLAAAGQRIGAAEEALRNGSLQAEAWTRRFSKIEARLDRFLRTARTQAEEIAGRAQERIQAELDLRTGTLQTRIDALESAQHSADSRLADVQAQLEQLRAAARPQPERTPEAVGPDRSAQSPGLDQLEPLDRGAQP